MRKSSKGPQKKKNCGLFGGVALLRKIFKWFFDLWLLLFSVKKKKKKKKKTGKNYKHPHPPIKKKNTKKKPT